MSLITACAIICSLKFHVVCTCTFFGDTICLLTNRQMIKIVTLIDLYVVLTHDCWHCFLVFNFWVSHALEMTINFYYPILGLFCFSCTQPFTHSKFWPFSLRCHPSLPPPPPPPLWPLPNSKVRKLARTTQLKITTYRACSASCSFCNCSSISF
jgi:hypothetical protein